MKEQKEQNRVILSAEEMSDSEMLNLLIELSRTPYWQAIIRFNNGHQIVANSALAILDPIKEPTKVSRTQGRKIGISLLKDYIDKETKVDIEE